MADNPRVSSAVLDTVMASPAGTRLVVFMARARGEEPSATYRWMRSDISELLVTALEASAVIPKQREYLAAE